MVRWSKSHISHLKMILETGRQQSVWAMARKAQEVIKTRTVSAIAHKLRELISAEEAQDSGVIVIDGKEYQTRNISGYAHIYIDGREVPVHIYLWEKQYGKVLPNHHIHHRNNKRWDNRLENLTMMTAAEHINYHHSGAPAETEMLFWFLQEQNLWETYLEFRQKIIKEVVDES